jgi:hypothetical protein
MSSNRFGESPSARRRARRRRLSGLDPTPPSPPDPRSAARPPARARPAPEEPIQPEEPRQSRPLFQWRGWDSVITYVILAAMLVGVITGLHRLLAAGILVLGASALAWGVTHRPGRRGTSGYGALLDWLMDMLPRPVYLFLCVVVTALGLVGVIVG